MRYWSQQHRLLRSLRRAVEHSYRYRFELQPLAYLLAGGAPVCIHGVYRLSEQELDSDLPWRYCPRCEWNALVSDQLTEGCRWVRLLLRNTRVANRQLADVTPTGFSSRLPYHCAATGE